MNSKQMENGLYQQCWGSSGGTQGQSKQGHQMSTTASRRHGLVTPHLELHQVVHNQEGFTWHLRARLNKQRQGFSSTDSLEKTDDKLLTSHLLICFPWDKFVEVFRDSN